MVSSPARQDVACPRACPPTALPRTARICRQSQWQDCCDVPTGSAAPAAPHAVRCRPQQPESRPRGVSRGRGHVVMVTVPCKHGRRIGPGKRLPGHAPPATRPCDGAPPHPARARLGPPLPRSHARAPCGWAPGPGSTAPSGPQEVMEGSTSLGGCTEALDGPGVPPALGLKVLRPGRSRARRGGGSPTSHPRSRRHDGNKRASVFLAETRGEGRATRDAGHWAPPGRLSPRSRQRPGDGAPSSGPGRGRERGRSKERSPAFHKTKKTNKQTK